MREHLFRGKYTDGNGNQHWIVGHYTEGSYINPDTGEEIKRYIISNEDGLFDVDPATVGELVAKDKNGRNVYEGDALKQTDAKGVYIVFYNDKYYRFDVRHTYGFTMELSRLLREYKNETTNLDAEVVGNIHENPELGKICKRK